MAIIYARRIPHGLSGAESCGPNQKWDPNYVFQGIKGQCVPASQPLVQMASQSTSTAGQIFTGLMSLFSTPKTATPTYVAPAVAPKQGMSDNTMIAIGLGALGLLAVVMIATRK